MAGMPVPSPAYFGCFRRPAAPCASCQLACAARGGGGVWLIRSREALHGCVSLIQYLL